MADVKTTTGHLDKIYAAVSDALVHSNKTYNTIKVEAAGISQLLKANASDDAKLKGLVAKIESKFTALHTAAGAFIKAKEDKHATVDSEVKGAYTAWRALSKSLK